MAGEQQKATGQRKLRTLTPEETEQVSGGHHRHGQNNQGQDNNFQGQNSNSQGQDQQ